MNTSFFSNNKPEEFSFLVDSTNPTISVTKTPGNGVWNFNNEKIINSNTPSYTMTGAGPTYPIKLYTDSFDKISELGLTAGVFGHLDVSKFKKLSVYNLRNNSTMSALTLSNNSTSITQFYAYSNPALTSLNLSGLTGLGGDIKLYSNSIMSALTLPNSSNNITIFHAYLNTSLKSLNLSVLSGLEGNIIIMNNHVMSSMTFPNSSNIISNLNMHNNWALPILNLSGLTGLGGQISLHHNTLMSSLILPNSSTVITEFSANDNPALTSLNLSGLTGLGGNISLFSNTGLTSITLPVSTQNISNFLAFECSNLGYVDFNPLSGSASDYITIQLQDNNWSSAIVNHVLYDLDQIGWNYGELNIGGTNLSADTSSGGYNGVLAMSGLTSKGWDISI